MRRILTTPYICVNTRRKKVLFVGVCERTSSSSLLNTAGSGCGENAPLDTVVVIWRVVQKVGRNGRGTNKTLMSIIASLRVGHRVSPTRRFGSSSTSDANWRPAPYRDLNPCLIHRTVRASPTVPHSALKLASSIVEVDPAAPVPCLHRPHPVMVRGRSRRCQPASRLSCSPLLDGESGGKTRSTTSRTRKKPPGRYPEAAG